MTLIKCTDLIIHWCYWKIQGRGWRGGGRKEKEDNLSLTGLPQVWDLRKPSGRNIVFFFLSPPPFHSLPYTTNIHSLSNEAVMGRASDAGIEEGGVIVGASQHEHLERLPLEQVWLSGHLRPTRPTVSTDLSDVCRRRMAWLEMERKNQKTFKLSKSFHTTRKEGNWHHMKQRQVGKETKLPNLWPFPKSNSTETYISRGSIHIHHVRLSHCNSSPLVKYWAPPPAIIQWKFLHHIITDTAVVGGLPHVSW